MNQPPAPLIAVRVKDGLFVGNHVASQDDDFLFMNKVGHIVNCAGTEVTNLFQSSGISYCTFHWRDAASTTLFDQDDQNILKCAEFIDKGLERGECVLVHSNQGINRCCCLVAAYLLLKYGWTLDNTVSFMTVAHPDMAIKPYFIRQLRTLAARRERATDIFHPSRDVSNLPLDSEELLLRNTHMNALPIDHPSNARLRDVVLRYERDRVGGATGGAQRRPGASAKPRIAFRDSVGGNLIVSGREARNGAGDATTPGRPAISHAVSFTHPLTGALAGAGAAADAPTHTRRPARVASAPGGSRLSAAGADDPARHDGAARGGGAVAAAAAAAAAADARASGVVLMDAPGAAPGTSGGADIPTTSGGAGGAVPNMHARRPARVASAPPASVVARPHPDADVRGGGGGGPPPVALSRAADPRDRADDRVAPPARPDHHTALPPAVRGGAEDVGRGSLPARGAAAATDPVAAAVPPVRPQPDPRPGLPARGPLDRGDGGAVPGGAGTATSGAQATYEQRLQTIRAVLGYGSPASAPPPAAAAPAIGGGGAGTASGGPGTGARWGHGAAAAAGVFFPSPSDRGGGASAAAPATGGGGGGPAVREGRGGGGGGGNVPAVLAARLRDNARGDGAREPARTSSPLPDRSVFSGSARGAAAPRASSAGRERDALADRRRAAGGPLATPPLTQYTSHLPPSGSSGLRASMDRTGSPGPAQSWRRNASPLPERAGSFTGARGAAAPRASSAGRDRDGAFGARRSLGGGGSGTFMPHVAAGGGGGLRSAAERTGSPSPAAWRPHGGVGGSGRYSRDGGSLHTDDAGERRRRRQIGGALRARLVSSHHSTALSHSPDDPTHLRALQPTASFLNRTTR